jgi:hypothetical protein
MVNKLSCIETLGKIDEKFEEKEVFLMKMQKRILIV